MTKLLTFRSNSWLALMAIACIVLAGCTENEGGGEDGEKGNDQSVGFVSSGLSIGTSRSIDLDDDESFAGLLGETEIALYYDPNSDIFSGRLRNEAMDPICDIQVTITADGNVANLNPNGSSFQLDGLLSMERADFEVPFDERFDSWEVSINAYVCDSWPSGEGGEGNEGSEGGESGGEHGGSGEGGGEHGGGGEGNEGNEGGEGGGESGDESSPATPITESIVGTYGSQDYSFEYDPLDGVFRGTVENVGDDTVCMSRTEIHLGAGDAVIELGPTIPVDLESGDSVRIVMSVDGGYVLDTYTLHPESSSCDAEQSGEGSEGGESGEGGGEHGGGGEGGGG